METYIMAWKTPGTDALKDIFTENCSYQMSPFRPAVKGLAALADFWEKGRESAAEKFIIQHEKVAIDGNTAVMRVDVHYADPPEHWKDLWIVTLDTQGRCMAFEEWPFNPDQDDGHGSD
jgi:hypothetical protein